MPTSKRQRPDLSRRRFVIRLTGLGVLAGLESLAPAWAWNRTGNQLVERNSAGEQDIFELAVRRTAVDIGARQALPITLNGSIPGPLIRLREDGQSQEGRGLLQLRQAYVSGLL
jgi:FtsP/CotA-like multicopper oxidase with cupredoxin domain